MNPRLRREYERVRDALAASGVTVYSIYAWNDGLVEFGAQQAFEGNVLDMSASAPDLSGIPFGSTMAALAADTGGESLTATSGLLDRLDRAERARSGSYSVAFRTPPGSAGKRLDIRVRVTRPGLRVHHRRLLRLGSDDDASGHTSMAALLSSAGENPSGIRVQVGSLTRDRLRRLRARVKIHIPADRVVFIERQGRHRGQLRFFASVRDAKGIYSSFDPRELTLDLSDAELSALRRNGTTYELELVASQGTTEVSVTVLDVPGRSHSTARFALDGGRG